MNDYIKYILLRFAYEIAKNDLRYNQNYTLNKCIDIFNEKNNFGKFKINLLPFIITVANGKRKTLLDSVFTEMFLSKGGFFDNQVYILTNASSLNDDTVIDNFSITKTKTIIESDPSYNNIASDTFIQSLFPNNTNYITAISSSIDFILSEIRSNFPYLSAMDLTNWHYNTKFYKLYKDYIDEGISIGGDYSSITNYNYSKLRAELLKANFLFQPVQEEELENTDA